MVAQSRLGIDRPGESFVSEPEMQIDLSLAEHTGTMESFRAIVVDDHKLTAMALADSLRSRGLQILAVEHSAAAGFAAALKQPCDVVLTDFDLGPGPSGIDLATKLRVQKPRVGVVILTAYEDPKLLTPSMPPLPRTVVYLVKQRVSQVGDILRAIELSVELAAGRVSASGNLNKFPLSEAQARILRLVAAGMSNAAIAQELLMSQATVSTSLKRLAKRFGISNDGETNVRVALTQHYFDLVGFQRVT